jgi:hypothetical protein
VNPSGEYCWLEQPADLPISCAIADVLIGRAARRVAVSDDGQVARPA